MVLHFGRLWFTVWEVDDRVHSRLTIGVATLHYYENRLLLLRYGSFDRYPLVVVDTDRRSHPKPNVALV